MKSWEHFIMVDAWDDLYSIQPPGVPDQEILKNA